MIEGRPQKALEGFWPFHYSGSKTVASNRLE
jgi:hypothetical protein